MSEAEASIEILHPHDVLCGRGHVINGHPGNVHFRSLVSDMRHEYVACPKSRRPRFAKKILEKLRSMDPPARMLKRNSKTRQWEEVDEKQCLLKTRQVLREGATDIKKKLESGEIVVTTNYEAEWDAMEKDPIWDPNQARPVAIPIFRRKMHEQKLHETLLKKIKGFENSEHTQHVYAQDMEKETHVDLSVAEEMQIEAFAQNVGAFATSRNTSIHRNRLSCTRKSLMLVSSLLGSSMSIASPQELQGTCEKMDIDAYSSNRRSSTMRESLLFSEDFLPFFDEKIDLEDVSIPGEGIDEEDFALDSLAPTGSTNHNRRSSTRKSILLANLFGRSSSCMSITSSLFSSADFEATKLMRESFLSIDRSFSSSKDLTLDDYQIGIGLGFSHA
mmetsp:Transcript_8227/g.9577  ORF Transcript_8227/g.9577 Transcript_8227/m.9577 type:complete len:389 (+) Transcript_8227:72-1238(+)|eukprot:CAMPEP_0204617650 /NCGR_PEP_ID=MMETSP0717-20131115/4552_1 /ASSEMBLY_ACC=CAM_ASM_000666 /TAXON_ID=230516 /ORGANISM="Chaetoceros curvisetus" /LENGTH=388 /DNA_ID=CAMNT_0051631227 /DNA_START=49 /DNA_END=1215 /DNA_ORIENTATION=-